MSVIARVCLSLALAVVLAGDVSTVTACKARRAAVTQPLPVKIKTNFHTFVKCENETEIELAGCLNGECMVYAEFSTNNVMVKRYSDFVKCYCFDDYEGKWCGDYRISFVEQRTAMVAGIIFVIVLLVVLLLLCFLLYYCCRRTSRHTNTTSSQEHEQPFNGKTNALSSQSSTILSTNLSSNKHNSSTPPSAMASLSDNLEEDASDGTVEKERCGLLPTLLDVHLFIDEEEDDL